MARDYFNYCVKGVIEKDLEWAELPSDNVALEEVQTAARELLAATDRGGNFANGGEFEVKTGDGTVFHTLPLRSV